MKHEAAITKSVCVLKMTSSVQPSLTEAMTGRYTRTHAHAHTHAHTLPAPCDMFQFRLCSCKLVVQVFSCLLQLHV